MLVSFFLSLKRISYLIIVCIFIFSINSCKSGKISSAATEERYNTKVVLAPFDSSITLAQQDWSKIYSVLESRLKSLNIQKYELNYVANQNNIILSLNANSKGANQCISALLNLLCQKGELVFCDSDNNVLFDNNDIQSAHLDKIRDENEVIIDFTIMGSIKLATVSKQYIGEKMNIYLDYNLLADPMVGGPITDGKACIYEIYNVNNFDIPAIAIIINSGPLPYKLKTEIIK